MKRSEHVKLAMMGAVTFAATFAAGSAFLIWQKPGHAAQPKGEVVAAAQTCKPSADGKQTCPPASQSRGPTYYLAPKLSLGSPSSHEPVESRPNSRPGSTALSSGPPRPLSQPRRPPVARSGFGATARRMSPVSTGG